MAIKGKKKSGSGRKPRAVAPKREVVSRTTPLVARRWFQLTLVSLLALGLGLGLGYGFGNQSKMDSAKATTVAKKKGVAALDGAIAESLQKAGSMSDTGFAPFPDLSAAIEAGDHTSARSGAGVRKIAKSAAEQLTGIELARYSGGLTADEQAQATEALGLLIQGMELFRQAGVQLEHGASASGAERSQGLASAKDLAASADAVTRFAYGEITRLKESAGLVAPQPSLEQIAQQQLQNSGTQPTVPTGPAPGDPAGP